jgi:methylglutamate dehydrogenase subunit D
MIASNRDSLALARVTARKGRTADLTRTVRERFGIDLPLGPRRAQSGERAFIGIGVDTWLATSESELDGFAASLRSVVDESATVSDQIGAYQVLRLTGPHVRDVLMKLVSIDLHPGVFTPGSAASTLAAHIPLTLWSDSGLIELAIPRSYSRDFRHLLAENAREFGFEG